MARFGDRIRELRRAVGLTQWQVAEQTGVSNTYISAIESGRKPAPPHVIVSALAACLQTDEDALWRVARAEREERLQRRIDGVPTSQRIPRSTGSSVDCDASPSGDPLADVLRLLNETAKDPRQRRSLAEALHALADSLRGNR